MLTSNHIYHQPTEISIIKQPSFFFFLKEQATQLVGASNQQNPQSIHF